MTVAGADGRRRGNYIGGQGCARSAGGVAGCSGCTGRRDRRWGRDDILCAEEFSDDRADEGSVCGWSRRGRNDIGRGEADTAAFETAQVTGIGRRRGRDDRWSRQSQLGVARGITFWRGDRRRHHGKLIRLHARRRNFVGHDGRRGSDDAAIESGSVARLIAGNALGRWCYHC